MGFILRHSESRNDLAAYAMVERFVFTHGRLAVGYQRYQRSRLRAGQVDLRRILSSLTGSGAMSWQGQGIIHRWRTQIEVFQRQREVVGEPGMKTRI
jgi:hypothetical protein